MSLPANFLAGLEPPPFVHGSDLVIRSLDSKSFEDLLECLAKDIEGRRATQSSFSLSEDEWRSRQARLEHG